MKKGDLVRVVGVPPGLRDEANMPTKRIFDLCLGRIFPMAGFQGHLLELEVGHVVGEPAYMHSIWIEPESVEFVGSPVTNETVPPAPNELAHWPELPQHISARVDTFPEASYGATTVTLVLSDGRRIERVVVGGGAGILCGLAIETSPMRSSLVSLSLRSSLRNDPIRWSVS